MTVKSEIEYDDFPFIVSNMWIKLARTIEESIPDAYVYGGPKLAMEHAWCAEACYWQARGEDHSPSVKEMLKGNNLEAEARQP